MTDALSNASEESEESAILAPSSLEDPELQDRIDEICSPEKKKARTEAHVSAGTG